VIVGWRYAVHPAHDLFMMGARYVTVESVGRKWIHVTDDAGHKHKMTGQYLTDRTD
jgi:hypothetical protein